MALTIARVVTLFAVASVMVVTTAGRAAGEVAACYMIRQGDTAALVSRRMTGRAQQQFQPWFQILDAKSRAVPKSQYNRIHAGWRACIPSARIVVARTGARRAAAPRTGAHRAAVALTGDNRAAVARTTGEHRPATAKAAVASGGVLQVFADSVASGALWGVTVFVVALLALDAWHYARRRRAVVSTMQQFGERFVWEFERPLRTPGCQERPVEAQLRCIPRRQRLEILLAPTGKRRYPNLSDHRRNVSYDAERIVRQLKEKRFVGGQLREHGKWVVFACDFQIHSE